MDIIGFDEQIGAPFSKAIKSMVKTTANKPKAVQVVTTSSAPKKVILKPTQAIKMVSKPVAKQVVAIAPPKQALIPKAKQVVAIAPPKQALIPKAKQVVAIAPPKQALMPKAKQVIAPPLKKGVKASPIFKKKIVAVKTPLKGVAVTTQKVLPNITNLSPQNQVAVVRNIPVTPQNMSQLNEIQKSFTKADLPYQPVVKSNPIVKVANTPLQYSISLDMIQPPVDAGTLDYYGK